METTTTTRERERERERESRAVRKKKKTKQKLRNTVVNSENNFVVVQQLTTQRVSRSFCSASVLQTYQHGESFSQTLCIGP